MIYRTHNRGRRIRGQCRVIVAITVQSAGGRLRRGVVVAIAVMTVRHVVLVVVVVVVVERRRRRRVMVVAVVLVVIVVDEPRATAGRPPLCLGVLVHRAVHHDAEQEHAGHGDELGTRLEVVLAGAVDGRPELLLAPPVGQLARQLRERQALRERQLVQRIGQAVHAHAAPGLQARELRFHRVRVFPARPRGAAAPAPRRRADHSAAAVATTAAAAARCRRSGTTLWYASQRRCV